MALVSTEIDLSNPRDRNIRPIKVKSLVYTGSLHLCVPEHVVIQLEFEELYKREVTTADGKKTFSSLHGTNIDKVRESRLLYGGISGRKRRAFRCRSYGGYGSFNLSCQTSSHCQSGKSEYCHVHRKGNKTITNEWSWGGGLWFFRGSAEAITSPKGHFQSRINAGAPFLPPLSLTPLPPGAGLYTHLTSSGDHGPWGGDR